MSETTTLVAPFDATVVHVVAEGTAVSVGDAVVVVESMKMEHEVTAPAPGEVTRVTVSVGESVREGDPLVAMTSSSRSEATTAGVGRGATDGTSESAALADLTNRRRHLRDDSRPESVARIHGRGRRTARENIADLVDENSFEEYGALAVAAQKARRPVGELQRDTPADGVIGGIATVDGHPCAVVSYDYMVLAGTQGIRGHAKKDRLFEVIERLELPVVLFAEGGGGRPGDSDYPVISGNDVMSFALFAGLSGLAPLVGIVSGRCFAGNAALAGCCDVIIATTDANLGMAGPAMIAGGGLGRVEAADIGPVDVQSRNGVLDLVVDDDAAAVEAARRYLSYFRAPVVDGVAFNGREEALRSVVPENRKRAYDMIDVIAGIVDVGSEMALRVSFGVGMHTMLARIAGRSVGVIANNPRHLGGAIDAEAADKAARFMQLCDAFDLPIVFLCDTPGFMVGPAAEETAQVRRFSRMMVTGASLTVPFMTVITRKGVGLGALAMSGGSFRAPLFTVAWPTGEISGMGLEGAVELGFRRELESIEDEAEREAAFEAMVAAAYERSRAVEAAMIYEIDDVVDPAETRGRILHMLESAPPPSTRRGKKRPMIDTW